MISTFTDFAILGVLFIFFWVFSYYQLTFLFWVQWHIPSEAVPPFLSFFGLTLVGGDYIIEGDNVATNTSSRTSFFTWNPLWILFIVYLLSTTTTLPFDVWLFWLFVLWNYYYNFYILGNPTLAMNDPFLRALSTQIQLRLADDGRHPSSGDATIHSTIRSIMSRHPQSSAQMFMGLHRNERGLVGTESNNMLHPMNLVRYATQNTQLQHIMRSIQQTQTKMDRSNQPMPEVGSRRWMYGERVERLPRSLDAFAQAVPAWIDQQKVFDLVTQSFHTMQHLAEFRVFVDVLLDMAVDPNMSTTLPPLVRTICNELLPAQQVMHTSIHNESRLYRTRQQYDPDLLHQNDTRTSRSGRTAAYRADAHGTSASITPVARRQRDTHDTHEPNRVIFEEDDDADGRDDAIDNARTSTLPDARTARLIM